MVVLVVVVGVNNEHLLPNVRSLATVLQSEYRNSSQERSRGGLERQNPAAGLARRGPSMAAVHGGGFVK